MTWNTKVFIDSNIPMYASGKEHPNREPSIKILESVSKGEITGITSTEVLQEILYRYHAINMLEKGLEVFNNFSGIVDEVLSINVRIMNAARDILKDNTGKIYPRDAVHIATMDHYGISYIASFDRHFNYFKHIREFILQTGI
ncbi:MAG: type II toxin-antitoxin system VapC family toxin [Actinobacteria bacterium]|nr:type II toxin-antitoxin system VapC family toxin [Actinomycetota bacterium]